MTIASILLQRSICGVFIEWTWVTGEPWGVYTNWAPGEPNYDYWAFPDLRIEMYPTGQWNDAPGYEANRTGYIVEYDYVCTDVVIDIKPGSDPNCINNNGHGVIPVAILGSSDFDVTTVDPTTVSLDGQAVRVVGKNNKVQAHLEDVNNDGFTDLVVQIEDVAGTYEEDNTTATLTGETFGGTRIAGTDTICIVPPKKDTTAASESGDMNGDNLVNILDLAYVASKFGSTDALADVNDDAVVDILDLAWLARQLD